MQALKEEHPGGFLPDAAWYRAFIAKAILFRAAQSLVRAAKFPAYQANITAYAVAALSWCSGGRIDFERIWARQTLSAELRAMLSEWIVEIDRALRATAGSRMPSEWAKKIDCRDALRAIPLALPTPLPPELAAQTVSRNKPTGRVFILNDGLGPEDLELVNQVRAIDAETWFRVAHWGKTTKQIHWKVAAIARTMGEYALGSWERSPSAKQAKWAMEAYHAAQRESSLAVEEGDC